MPGVSVSRLPSLLPVLLLLSIPPPSVPRRLTPLEKVRLLDRHNWYRASLPGLDAQGQPLPTAADMNTLEWDDSLEALAQEWADLCPRTFGYRDCPSYPAWRHKVAQTFELANIGQIILVYQRNLTGTSVDVLSALNKTYSMVAHYNPGSGGCNTTPGGCDSFIQMVWSRTRKLGCAMGQTCNHLVCNYHPQGNEMTFTPGTGWQKKPFATPGAPCTQCQSGTGWCSQGLCIHNLTTLNRANCTCEITSCEEGGTVRDCVCQCPRHRLGNRCEVQCHDEVECSGLGVSACYNLYIYDHCPALCQRCIPESVADDWSQPNEDTK